MKLLKDSGTQHLFQQGQLQETLMRQQEYCFHHLSSSALRKMKVIIHGRIDPSFLELNKGNTDYYCPHMADVRD